MRVSNNVYSSVPTKRELKCVCGTAQSRFHGRNGMHGWPGIGRTPYEFIYLSPMSPAACMLHYEGRVQVKRQPVWRVFVKHGGINHDIKRVYNRRYNADAENYVQQKKCPGIACTCNRRHNYLDSGNETNQPRPRSVVVLPLTCITD
jgi:hypothetical protein